MLMDRRSFGAIAAAAFVLTATATVAAQGRSSFYNGKTIDLIIPNAPGGSFDLYGRLVARHLGRFIPGNPTIVPENMPGAAGMISANWLYDIAPKDGSAIGISVPNIALAQVIGISGIRYDVRKLNWIGRIVSPTATLFVSRTAPVKSLADLQHKQLIIASTGPLSQAEITSKMMNDVVGAKFKIIHGYKGTGDAILALERGEVQAAVMPWTFMQKTHPDWLKNGMVRPIAQYTRKPIIGLNAPSIFALAKTSEQKGIFQLFFGPDEIGQALYVPPKAPEDRVAMLRKAFEAMNKSAQFKSDAAKEGLAPTPASWQSLQKAVEAAFKATPDQIATARKYFGEAR